MIIFFILFADICGCEVNKYVLPREPSDVGLYTEIMLTAKFTHGFPPGIIADQTMYEDLLLGHKSLYDKKKYRQLLLNSSRPSDRHLRQYDRPPSVEDLCAFVCLAHCSAV